MSGAPVDPIVARTLARLRAAADPALADLARLVVDEATATPLREVAPPRWVASQLATAIKSLGDGEQLAAFTRDRFADARDRWGQSDDTPGALLPNDAREPLRALLARPYTPNEDLTYRVIQHPALSNLVRAVLSDTLLRFRKRMSSVDQGLLGGLGGRAARRGKSLFGGLGAGISQNLSGLAHDLVETVKDEVEHSLDQRLTEFLAGATDDAVRYIAAYLADPSHADVLASMRVSVFEVLLDTPISALLAELDKLDPAEGAVVVLHALRAAADRPDFVDRAATHLEALQREVGDGTLGDWLAEVGLAEVWTETTTELVRARLQAVVATDAFAQWWADLHAPAE